MQASRFLHGLAILGLTVAIGGCDTVSNVLAKKSPVPCPDATIMKGEGCDSCKMTGSKGRLGIYEIFEIDDEVRHMVNEELTTPQLRRRARELGMRTLREDGIRKVLSGITTATEVVRSTMSDGA